jgi:general secretion pathway protein G
MMSTRANDRCPPDRYRLMAGMGGFTFVELMITLALLAVLATVAVPMVQLVLQRQKEHDLRAALAEIREALDAYKRAVDQGEIQISSGESGYPKSLDQLVEGVESQRDLNKKRLYFLRRLPRDPMDAGQESLSPSRSWGARSYASPPDLPAEGEDVFDIHSRSDKPGLNGVPYRQW